LSSAKGASKKNDMTVISEKRLMLSKEPCSEDQHTNNH
jgi:hypothetical protein